MIKKSIFREYDIRGIVPEELNEQSIKLLGYYFGLEAIKQTNNTPTVVVGYDARTHSPELFGYLTSGLNEAGCKVLGMGMVATGVNYFSTFQKFDGIEPDASIMITGSHNPSEYNGFKMTIDHKPFFADAIYALGDKIIANQNMVIETNEVYTKIDAKSMYIDWMVKEFSHLKGMSDKFIIDCGNGVADTVLTEILDKLELNYDGIYCDPDGTFPNHHPDPSEEKNLKDVIEALKGEYKYAFAYDGDADRIAFLTKKHNVKGDIMAILFASTMDKPTVIGEVKCTQVMYDKINADGGKAIMYKTGHSNLKVKINETNADFAAEVSGHIFFNDRYFGFDDAVYATFRLLELIQNGMDIDKEIDALPKTYSTEEIKVYTTEEEKFPLIDKVKELLQKPEDDFPIIKDIIDVDGVRVIFEDGWGLVRASNTTPVLVTRFESTNEQKAKLYEQKLNELIKKAQESL
ncbi:MAG: phosphomannomutase/phosphoglucomutase [Campylobacteraceae bacterium]|jgi:phosphomannomutase/phosphoglucomutase|nr:phosphomannomutase/phosphoglucomutase [Campylobacteraceae bacterium]MBT6107056.1 phosphomannomutase/phosphoglucomutase [Campylobacteraceae bacterium]MBT7117313.1 phosphomannomutase/phosphoglucomutase [Campylobacteraceae bacterium]